jgi:hypothetical protein
MVYDANLILGLYTNGLFSDYVGKDGKNCFKLIIIWTRLWATQNSLVLQASEESWRKSSICNF